MVWRVNEESLIFKKMERKKIKEEKKGRKRKGREANAHQFTTVESRVVLLQGHCTPRCSPGDTEGLVCTL